MKMGRWALGFGLLGLIAAAVSPLGIWLILPLEDRFPRPDPTTISDPAGIIVLGGTINPSIGESRGVVAVNEAAERLIVGSALAKKFPKAKFAFTGESNVILAQTTPKAKEMQEVLLSAFDIPRDKLIVEYLAKNTFQNALFMQKILRPKKREKWILVTSGYHMPRAVGCFRKAGFDVIPWVADYRTRGRDDLTTFSDKPSEGLRLTDKAAKEWVGLLAYWITGRIDRLFPGPTP
jgi:uncharacterized SAM-binding protein YcdF (DUF218 family)